MSCTQCGGPMKGYDTCSGSHVCSSCYSANVNATQQLRLAKERKAIPMPTTPTTWTKVTQSLLDNQPDWLHEPLWIAHRGTVVTGFYEWRQGRNPDRLVGDSGEDIDALDDCHIMPLVKPEAPSSQP